MPRLKTLYKEQREQAESSDLAMIDDSVSLLSGWWTAEDYGDPRLRGNEQLSLYTDDEPLAVPERFAAAADDRTLPPIAARVQRGQQSDGEFVYAVSGGGIAGTVYARIGQFERFPRKALQLLYREHARSFLRTLKPLWYGRSAFERLLVGTLATVRFEGLGAVERYVGRRTWLFRGEPGTGKTTMAEMWSRFLYLLGVVTTGHVSVWNPVDALTSADASKSIDFINCVATCGGTLIVRNAELLAHSDAGRYLITRIVSGDSTHFPRVVLCTTAIDRSSMERRLLQACECVKFDLFNAKRTVQTIVDLARAENDRVKAQCGERIYDWSTIDPVWLERHLLPRLNAQRPFDNSHAARQFVRSVHGRASVRWVASHVSDDDEVPRRVSIRINDVLRACHFTKAERGVLRRSSACVQT